MKLNQFKQRIKALPIFSSSLLSSITNDVSTLKVQLTKWKKKGLIISLRKGLYVLGDKEREIEPSNFYLANQIIIPSYISLESALSYYGLIPEFVASITSITIKKTCRFENQFGTFTYQHIKSEGFTGFDSKKSNNLNTLIACPEKAVVDFLYLNLHKFTIKNKDVFKKSYRFQNCNDLSLRKIKYYAKILKSKKLSMISEMFIQELIQ